METVTDTESSSSPDDCAKTPERLGAGLPKNGSERIGVKSCFTTSPSRCVVFPLTTATWVKASSISAFGEKNQKAADEAANTSSTEAAAATRKKTTFR